MKQKRRMWFGVVTAMILLLVIIDRYDLHRSVKKWCDRTDTFCATTRLLLNVKRVKYLKSCEGCFLAEVDFSSLDLTGVNLRGAHLKDAKFNGAVLKGANLSDSTTHRVGFSLADLSNSNLSGADLDQSDFSGANLTNAVLTSADLQDVSLKGAILNSTDLRSATLHRSDLTDATLTNSKLGGAEFERAYLARTVFEHSGKLNADFTDAIMGRANLQGLNLSNTCPLEPLPFHITRKTIPSVNHRQAPRFYFCKCLNVQRSSSCSA